MFNLNEFLLNLERIAKLNHDNWNYRFDVVIRNGRHIMYQFVCEEAAEGHTLFSGLGDTPEEAAMNALPVLEQVLKDWDYKS